MTHSRHLQVRRNRCKINGIDMWRIPEHKFMVRDYFRKLEVPTDMFPKNYYDLGLLKKFESHFEMKLPESMYVLCGDEYSKFMDMTDDLIDYVRFYKIDVDEEPGIEFISLRRCIDKQILDRNFTNSVEAENDWKLLVQNVFRIWMKCCAILH
jgi:hypothetical protein